MTKLRIILSYNRFLIFIFFILIIRILLHKDILSKYSGQENDFTCKVLNITRGDKNKYDLLCDEKVIGYSSELYEIGDILKIKGYLFKFEEKSNFNLFDYKKYYNKQGIFYRLIIDNADRVGKSSNIDLLVKNKIYNRISNLKTFPYLNSLILGNKNEINRDTMDMYKDMGLIHIFSISGMHLGLIIIIIEKVFKKTKKGYIFIILYFYYTLIDGVSILRSLLYFLLKYLDEKLYLRLSKLKIIILMLFIILFINPNYLYNIGFYYSVIISSFIIIYPKKKYLPFVIFLSSLPLNLYLNSEISFFTIIYNMIIIPIFTLIIYPLSLLTFIFTFLDIYLMYIINALESVSKLIGSINISIIMIKPSLYIVFLYYLLIIVFLFNKKYVTLLLIAFFIHYNYNQIFPPSYLIALDVGEGDSFLISHNNFNILIDTGINVQNYITIPLLKSLGIRKIDLLIISHGDSDHIEGASTLLDKYQVDRVYLNNNDINNFEREVINKSKNKHNIIDKRKDCFNDIYIYSRSYKENSENDSSILNYIRVGNRSLLFMGDASKNIEERFVKEANIKEIDILKVSHHGSKTSTSEEVINKINPKYSIISLKKNNRYNFPHIDTLKTLDNRLLYRTDLHGSIKISLKDFNVKTIKNYDII